MLTILNSILFVSLLFTAPYGQASKDCGCEKQIVFPEIGIIEAPVKLPADFQLQDDKTYSIVHVTDCRGASSFKTYDAKTKQLKDEGEFFSAGQLSTDTIYLYDENTYFETMKIVDYYKAVK